MFVVTSIAAKKLKRISAFKNHIALYALFYFYISGCIESLIVFYVALIVAKFLVAMSRYKFFAAAGTSQTIIGYFMLLLFKCNLIEENLAN